jgi:tripartite-type tricarboxylate transporter receptor subunit TctC
MFLRCLAQALVVLAAVSTQGLVWASEFPSRPITLVVPFGAGGGTDFLGRVIAEEIDVGARVIVENKPGAGSMLAANWVAKAPADGYTIFLVTNSTIAVGPLLNKASTIDPTKDFVPLAMVSGSPFFLTVSPKLPAQSVADLIKLAKEKPKQITHASAGVGSTAHIFMELFMKLAGVQLVHVPYKGSGQAMNDVMAGHVNVAMTDPATAIAAAGSGKAKVIGISTKARHPALPDVPSISEAGVRDYDAIAWVAIVARSGTPPDILQKLHVALMKVVTSPKFRAHLTKNGSTIVDIPTQEGMAKFFQSEIATWAETLKSAGLVSNAK